MSNMIGKQVQLSVYVSKQQYRKLLKIKKTTGVPMAVLMRLTVDKVIKEYEG